jgi:site-specific recombinase XerD
MRILQPSHTRKLLASIRLRSPFGLRDHAVVRLLSQTGLRVSELVGLDVGHVFYDGAPRHQLDLPAAACKGHRSRVIPLNEAARQAIQDLVDFLVMRGFQSAPDSPLLQDRRHRRLPVREVQRLVQTHRQAAGLDIRATPHSFRHSFASQLASKVSLRVVQQLLGHRFLVNTEIYLHNQPAQLAQAVATLPPF